MNRVSNLKKFFINLSFPLILGLVAFIIYPHFAFFPSKYLLVIFPAPLLLLLPLAYILKRSLYSIYTLQYIFIFFIFAFTFMLFRYYGNGDIFPFNRLTGDFLFPLSYFAFSTLSLNFLKEKVNKKILSLISSIISTIICLIPLSQLLYFLKFKKGITIDALFAFYQTNFKETIEYLASNMDLPLGVLSVFIILFIFFFFFILNLGFIKNYSQGKISKKSIGFLVFTFIFTIVFFCKVLIFANFIKIVDYNNQLKSYSKYQEKAISTLVLDKENSALTKSPGTIIVVIGESANRDYMKAFNDTLPQDTTPWQSEMAKDTKHFHFFPHGYSSYVQTVQALKMALTEENQYTKDKDFLHSLNIINVANKLGYNTYWLSNQEMVGRYDTNTSLVAKAAKKMKFGNEASFFDTPYDIRLLEYLKEIPKDQNNFIVLHLMGSHLGYQNRYPKEFGKFTNEGNGLYLNTIYYNDHVLKEIFNYAKENLNLTAMLYFSDHGEDMKLNHNPDTFTFSMARIPLWIYTSDRYNLAFPNKVQNYNYNKDKYFTNDLIFDMVLGLLNAGGNSYQEKYDLGSKHYQMKKEDLTTLFGKVKITEDPNIK